MRPTVLLRAALVMFLLCVTAAAHASAPRFRYERTVTPGARGGNRLDPDVMLLIGARPIAARAGTTTAGLEDFRLFDASGREVGYLLIAPPVPSEQWQSGTTLPVVATDTSSGFEVDLGAVIRTDRLRLDGIGAPFLKRLRLEGSGDREHWAILADSATVFDLPDEQLRRTSVSFPAADLRYLRVSWDDRNSAVVTAPRAIAARVAIAAPQPGPMRVQIGFERRPSEPGISRFRLKLPGARLPIVAFELGCGGQHLLRKARINEPRVSGDAAVPVALGSHTLQRAVRGDLIAADLRIPISPPTGAELDLVVEDGDNPPLALLTVEAELTPLPWIFFESTDGATLTARYGDPDLSAPSYDLEAMRNSVAESVLTNAGWGTVQNLNPPEEKREDEPLTDAGIGAGAALNPDAFSYRRAINAGPLGLTALVLDAGVLAHSRRLADVRIGRADGRQIPYLVEALGEPLEVELPALTPITDEDAPAQPRQSHYRLVLPYASMPPSRLVLSTSARVFDRALRVRIERQPSERHSPRDKRPRTRHEDMASVHWRHADTQKGPGDLVISLPSLATAEVELIVDDGDNSPLPIERPRLLLPAYRLRFFRNEAGALTLLYGASKVDAPRYDLALLAPRVLSAAANEVHLEPEAAVQPAPAAVAKVEQAHLFWAALVLALVVLVALIARLVAKV